jgi:acyl-CoA synthetase (AMP-forming)/AMP-acid ligase II
MNWALANILRTHAAERGAAPMITFGERVTWKEMARRAARVAQGLLAAGVRPQDRVAFLDKNGLEHFEVLLGGGMANVVNVAVNWRLAPAEVRYIVDDARARVLFVGAEFLPHLAEVGVAALGREDRGDARAVGSRRARAGTGPEDRKRRAVFPRQGHYAHDPKALATYPPADVSVERIGDLLGYELPALIAAASAMGGSQTRR